jgi:DNA-binding LytR/AlgR family response regulator
MTELHVTFKIKDMKTPRILKYLNEKSIFQFQASSNYTFLFFKNGKKEISAYTLKVYEDLFDEEDFVKIDRSNLVRKDYISRIVKKDNVHVVELINSTEIQIPRRRWSNMKANYPEWIC